MNGIRATPISNTLTLEQLAANMEMNQEKAVEGQEVVFVIGNTGAGKSTFINYMAGRVFRKAHSELRSNVICDNPLLEVGHTAQSCTSTVRIFRDVISKLAFCDCPGFFDNRGVAVEIANAISLSRIAKSVSKVKGFILCVEYPSLTGLRGGEMNKAINSMKSFLGPQVTLDSVFLLITKGVDYIQNPTEALNELATESSVVAEFRAKRNVGFYSPMDDFATSPDVYTRTRMQNQIHIFSGIANAQNTFNIVLNDGAINSIHDLVDEAMRTLGDCMQNFLASRSTTDSQAGPLLQLLRSISALRALGNDRRITTKLAQFDDALSMRIQLLGDKDDAKPHLEFLRERLPTQFILTIQQVLSKIEERTTQRKKQDERVQALERANGAFNEQLAYMKQQYEELKRQAGAAQGQAEQLGNLLQVERKNATDREKTLRDLLTNEQNAHLSTRTQVRQLTERVDQLTTQLNQRQQFQPMFVMQGLPPGFHYWQ